MKRTICVRRTGTLFCLLGHFTFYWDTLRSTWTLPIYWDTFRSPGTLSGLLGHFPVYWGTFLSTGTLYSLLDTSCLLGHFPVYWDTFLSTGTPLTFYVDEYTINCLDSNCGNWQLNLHPQPKRCAPWSGSFIQGKKLRHFKFCTGQFSVCHCGSPHHSWQWNTCCRTARTLKFLFMPLW